MVWCVLFRNAADALMCVLLAWRGWCRTVVSRSSITPGEDLDAMAAARMIRGETRARNKGDA